MTKRPLSILILAGVAALALAGCKGDKTTIGANHKSNQPIPAPTLALMAEKGMRKEDPILVRVYKEDSQLEVWKKRQDGKFAHMKTYEICRWSGALGPKKKEGDKQAPEGFYTVTPGQMNPNSAYFLSFDMGFPNAYDRSLGRTGKHLMVHGDCLSAGCYAMTDPQMAEVYALAREAFRGGQKSFQVQALPFRMTADNMARRRNDPNIAFWKNLKQGSDHFEVTRLEPKVNACGQKYVFNAQANGTIDPNAACPSYQVEPAIATAVAAKAKRDEQRFAELVSGGYQIAGAYVPQNGRLRRNLGEPVSPGVMVAAAPSIPDLPVEAPSAPSVALAMAASEPAPAPSPYTPAPKAETARSSGGLMGWMRRDPKPAELETPRTPSAAPVAVADAATAGSTPQAQPRPPVAVGAPVTASLGGDPNYRPFYRQMLGVTDARAQQAAPAAAASSAMPVARPAAATQRPAARAQVPPPAAAPAAVEAPAPAPTRQTAQNLPQPAPSGIMSSAPILGTGTFR
jgi:murein L,D-transpeptidase YafK